MSFGELCKNISPSKLWNNRDFGEFMKVFRNELNHRVAGLFRDEKVFVKVFH
jgi:hypothetical protein